MRTSRALVVGTLAAAVVVPTLGSSRELPCRGGTIEAVVSLDYEQRIVGDVAALFLRLEYPDAVEMPGSGTESPVRERIRSLLDDRFRVVGTDEDSDADGRQDRMRILASMADGRSALPSGPVVRVRFDCRTGAPVEDRLFRCSTDQVADGAGQMMVESEARKVTCSVRLEESAPSVP